MSKQKKIEPLSVVAVLISLILSFLLFAHLNPESWMKKDKTPISLSDIPAGDNGAFTGKEAGEDIKQLSGSKEFLELTGSEYVSVIPKEVIKTGIYGLKPWLDPYKITTGRNTSGRRYRSGRKAAEATGSFLFAAAHYIPYYLIKLPDNTYVLAQFSDTYKDAIDKGESVVLPLGLRKNTGNETRTYLKEICETYGADPNYVLYAIDNQWNKDHEFTLFMIRFGISAVVCLLLSVVLMTVGEKMWHRS